MLVEFLLQFVKRSLDPEQFDQAIGSGSIRRNAGGCVDAPANTLRIALQEHVAGASQPGGERRFEALTQVGGGLERAIQRCDPVLDRKSVV